MVVEKKIEIDECEIIDSVVDSIQRDTYIIDVALDDYLYDKGIGLSVDEFDEVADYILNLLTKYIIRGIKSEREKRNNWNN